MSDAFGNDFIVGRDLLIKKTRNNINKEVNVK